MPKAENIGVVRLLLTACGYLLGCFVVLLMMNTASFRRLGVANTFASFLFTLTVLAMLHFSSANPLSIVLPALGYLLTVYFVMMLMSTGASDT